MNNLPYDTQSSYFLSTYKSPTFHTFQENPAFRILLFTNYLISASAAAATGVTPASFANCIKSSASK